jgi:hypothetical protein
VGSGYPERESDKPSCSTSTPDLTRRRTPKLPRREAAGGFGFRRLLTLSPMAYGPRMAMLPAMLEDHPRRAGWSVGAGRSVSGGPCHEQ